MRGRGGKIQKQKRNTTEEEGSSSQVNRQNNAYWKKFNIWYRKLRYWRHNSVPHCIDFMHVEKNVTESLVETLLHVPGKTKDGVNARLDLAELGVKPELFAMQEEDKTTLPPAGYTLTNAEKDTFCETLHNIRVPQGHVRNKNKPEGCIAEETIAEEIIEFFSEYHKSMETIGILPDKHETDENEEGKPLSAGKLSEVYAELFQKAHLAGGVKCDYLGYTLVDLNNLGHKVYPFILASQARQVFYVKDQIDKKLSIVFKTPPKNYKDTYDEFDEEFSTVIHQCNDNILPCVNRRDLVLMMKVSSDDESEVEIIPKDKTVSSSTEKIKFVKSARETIEKVETSKQNKHYPRGNQRNWNNLMSQRLGSDFKMINKACFVCGSFEHLHYVCDKKVIRPVWNNSSRVNHKSFANKMTHPHPNRRFVSQVVLTRSGKINNAGVSVNTTVRPVNTVGLKTTVNHPRPISNAYKKGYSQVTRLFNKYSANKSSIFNKKVNTVRVKDTTARDRVVGNPQRKEYKEKGVIESGCSRHMTVNKCYLTEYEDYDGGFVSFGDGKGRISRKVLLRVPRKDNIYSVGLKSVVPTKGLTCLFAKATIDESNLWHRRLGHINFKNMNKLVRGNLVRGLPSKIFENDHSCVACQKGKQHKASCKAKLVNSISKPLHMLHMDLFGPTNVKSLMKKSYCLVVTDDFSRFSWVFFLATKDETSGILKTFITEIENQLDYKVKVIRSDNGTEFKNSVMNQFCEMKGIKREFSVARTPQQNGVAERRNRTLIEAARTMLVDSKLPTTFWAEAVNTACYVLNRVLVIKPHNKTPYELIRGRTPLIDFMKPFGCPVTILNTRDHLGKFDGKADEGFFVGYSVVSKAMRVFNKRTRIVEETLNIRFLENTPNVTGNGPDWLFDVDSLTISMNYVPVVAGNQTNGIAGTRDNIVTGQAEKKTEPEQEYILIPFCTTDPLISQGPKDSEEDSGMKPTEVDVSGASDKDGEDDQATRSEFERLLQQEKQTVHPNSTNSINTVSTPVSTAGPSFTNDAPSSPVNAARTSEEHLFEQFSPFKNAFTLPDVPNVFSIDDTRNTRIFGNAYDDEDVGADADLNNLETTMNVSPIPTTRIDKDHPKDQIIRDFNSAIQTRE
ncbi:putative ribonuclease H-like domain-containing protein [Tanacetum coccineum]